MCFKSDLRSWGEPWGIPPPLGSFAGLRSPTLTAFLVFFFLSSMFVTCPLLGCLWFVCLFFVARINNFHHGWNETFEASRHFSLSAAFCARLSDWPLCRFGGTGRMRSS